MSHDGKNRIEQQDSADIRTNIPEFGWIKYILPNKFWMETVSHINRETYKRNKNTEGKAPKVASNMCWPHCGR